MKREDPRHGTRAGWLQHRKEGKKPCRPCLDANAAYMREHRSKTTGWRDQNQARSRAAWRLVDLHRDEFEQLYIEERMKQRNADLMGKSA